jgi:hypothetical protein
VAQFGGVPRVALAAGGADEHDRAPARITARDALAAGSGGTSSRAGTAPRCQSPMTGLWHVVLAAPGGDVACLLVAWFGGRNHMMNRKTFGGWLAAAAMGTLLTVSLGGMTGAQALTPTDQPSSSSSPSSSASPSPSSTPDSYAWWGADHPGQDDPNDPVNNDWHCDRSGNWHNDENDPLGHPDSRCQTW